MLKSITFLIPNFRRKKGMARMKSVSEIWEIDMMMAGNLTARAFLKRSILAKSCRNVSPYALVNCRDAPRSMAKRKNRAIFEFLNSLKASSPSAWTKDRFMSFPQGRDISEG